MDTILLKLFLALCLIIVNGFFVLAEFSIVKVRRTRLEELGNAGNGSAKIALKISHHLDSYLSAIQLGITLASLALGWLGQPAVAALLGPALQLLPPVADNPILAQSLSFAVAFFLITLLHVVIGELVPKSLAIQLAEKMTLIVALPLYIFHTITYPFVYIFDHVAAFFLKLMGVTPGAESDQHHSEEELRMIVSASQKEGILDDTESSIVDNAFILGDKKAHEIMVPRTDIVCVYLDDDYETNIATMLNSRHTRFPLCKDDKDNIIGMIHLRDLFENEAGDRKSEDLLTMKREMLYIPYSLNLSSIMKLMQKRRIHLAVVVDEYGGTAGIISFEDIIEELVGEIQDEYDQEENYIEQIDEATYIVNGATTQGELEEFLGIDLGEKDDETIGGIVFSELGRKVEEGDTVTISGFTFTVIEVEYLRIVKIKVTKAQEV